MKNYFTIDVRHQSHRLLAAASIAVLLLTFLFLPVQFQISAQTKTDSAADVSQTQAASLISTTLVVSQFQVAGGTAADEFVELHNVSGSQVDLDGFRLVYRSAGGTSDVTIVNWTASAIIPAGGYYLIASASGYEGSVTPDITFRGTGSFAGSGGGLALRNGAGTIIDSVGYGTVTNAFIETTATTAPAADASRARNNAGCADTDDNSADFGTLNPSAPRNLVTAANICGGGTPALSIGDVAQSEGSGTTTFTFTVTLSQAAAANVTFDIATADGTAQDGNPVGEDTDYVAKTEIGRTISAGATSATFTVTVNGDTNNEPTETFFVNMTNASANVTISDAQAQGTIINDDVTNVTRIHQIQGTGAAFVPAFGGTQTVEGVIVGYFPDATNGLGGFYVQEENTDVDGNPLSSEGIFVADAANSYSTGAVGNRVRLTGTVSEAFNQTQIALTGTVTVLSTGQLGLVTPVNVDLSVTSNDGNGGNLERYEGMLVNFPAALTVTDNFELGRFGEVTLSSGGYLRQPTDFIDPNDNPATGTNSSGTSNIAAVTAQQTANNRNRIILDDGRNLSNPVNVPFLNRTNLNDPGTLRIGSTITGLTGIMGFGFGDFRLIRNPLGANDGLNAAYPLTINYAPRPAVPTVGGNVKVASFNVLNYFTTLNSRGANTAAEFTRQKNKIVAAIQQLNADVVGLIEIENNGATAIGDLVSALNAAGPNTYAAVTDPSFTGSDVIKVAFIYKPGVVSLDGAALSSTNTVFSRPPVAQTFTLVSNGQKFTAIINHFKSKGGGGTGLDADQGDGQAAFNNTRKLQSAALLGFINTLTADPDVIILGDLNAYSEEDPIDILRAGNLTKLNTGDGYQFGGQIGSLDHAMVNPALLARVSGAGKWNINAFEPISLDYNDNIQTAGENATTNINRDTSLYVADPYRSSDHDPILVGLNLNVPTAASVSIGGRVFAGEGRGLSNAFVTLTNMLGTTRTARTNSFGYYRFDGTAAGETYTLSVSSKRYQFAPLVLYVTNDFDEINFAPIE